jgi:flagellar basal body-associated protein FliL
MGETMVSLNVDDGELRRRGSLAERILLAVAAVVVLALIAGTAVGLATGSRGRKLEREALDELAARSGSASYWSIGLVRAKSADPKAAVVVAGVAFPYDPRDRAFAEELERMAPALKAAAIACLERRKAAELSPAYEGAVKAALRDAFNALLSLGEVDEIWLSEFSVIE